MKTDIISRMEAMQERFGNPLRGIAHLIRVQRREREKIGKVLQLPDHFHGITKMVFPSLLQSAENDRRLQLKDRADWVQPGDPPALPGESELDYNERTGRYDQ